MTIEFSGEIYFWKGPAPWYFVRVPEPQASDLHAVMLDVTYGWGMIPVDVTIGETTWYTALWPKDGSYILPIKASIRKAEKLAEGDMVVASMEIIPARELRVEI